jgi:hypothetical protein
MPLVGFENEKVKENELVDTTEPGNKEKTPTPETLDNPSSSNAGVDENEDDICSLLLSDTNMIGDDSMRMFVFSCLENYISLYI